jgi:tRNA(Ile)-lysidine synthase
MDGATELTWTYLQRPPQPAPPRYPTECPLLLLLLPLPLPSIRRVQGAALPTTPYRTGTS